MKDIAHYLVTLNDELLGNCCGAVKLDFPKIVGKKSPMEFSAIIVAAGKGERVGQGIPKQWRELGGKPVLRWSAEAMARAGAKEVVVVIRPRDKALADAALEGIPGVKYADGGVTRARSVANGLSAASPVDALLIHDAARPFIPDGLVGKLLEQLGEYHGAIPGIAMEDTLKRATPAGVETAPREGLWRAQTPQAFRDPAIREAYNDIRRAALVTTDDAAVVEVCGGKIKIVPGDARLMKLTLAEDFLIAEAIASLIK